MVVQFSKFQKSGLPTGLVTSAKKTALGAAEELYLAVLPS